MQEKVFAVIPAFNEEKEIGKVVKETQKFVDKVFVVDDGSSDATAEVAEKNGAIVVQNVINMGKGNALRTGIKASLLHNPDVVVSLDGDGQHNPYDIEKLLKVLKKEKLDVVFGSRSFRKKMPLTKTIGNFLINKASSIFFGINLKDTQCGFRAFKAEVFDKIVWQSNGYEMESEMVFNVGKNKLRFKEVPIQTIYSDKFKGTSVFDGLRIVLSMLWWRISKWNS